MFNILVWSVYGLLVGSIAKSIIPGEENFGFTKTIILGICGSYVGGSLLYMIGQTNALEPAGVFMGIIGSSLAIVIYNKLTTK